MTPEQQAAYINAQAVCALAEIAGMTAENEQRKHRGEAMAYVESAFEGIARKYGIRHNAVVGFFHQYG